MMNNIWNKIMNQWIKRTFRAYIFPMLKKKEIYIWPNFPIYPIGPMYGIYAHIGGILMGSMLPYIADMDPITMVYGTCNYSIHGVYKPT